ncbi:peptide/nickel transport system substrate-binding protein [Actinopolymorpha cephalotaxi]|uniref:Peptide/nickel transport system substrate-binding protein n=1 Tax=Actinopolymorpha cephalotaxi TaxID=504797 RepID=A0A1I2L114_9ACTN|nr:ABC transporter substrate-binding protein [Actinopolymorpha cephalotaxi]NYH84704.1 peptide/nickel transport system substrate-binding protein [Actinopolymorpha cephalotaxi]SFF71021.1 peptide/nickel transport system substrate-binding protein [Actinopolymorpha cephalotaxi]
MNDRLGLSRRALLHLSAVAAGSVVLAGCSGGDNQTEGGGPKGGAKPTAQARKGSRVKPVAVPAKLKESPELAKLVQAGKLPKLEERLPRKPYVVPHNWLTPGKYGGVISTVTSASDSGTHAEYMYGHSLLRYLNDGQDIGPGLVESWESNADASEWTLHFREGLKWSDGQPWSTDDIMFWWKDMVLNTEHSEVPPDEARSGKGTVMTMTAPDALTISMKFDAPAPLTADRLAMWVNRGNGPGWMEPKHYLKQWHPKYNKSVGKDWATDKGLFDQKRAWIRNPDCPVMTGWKCQSYKDGRRVVFERNPYYWCVAPDGAQLPYLDALNFNVVQNPEVQKLQAVEGKLNFLFGGFTSLFLSDISSLKQSQAKTKLAVVLWDAGDGSGSLVFFNQDYYEPKMRKLIRTAKFRQALSHAYNRAEVQKAVYYNTGELTTGTMSPKAIEFHVNDEGKKVYRSWRDSYIKYDPELAKKILDEIGVVDKDGDGKREMPDGSKLVVRLDYQADTAPEHQHKNNLLKKDWDAIGIDTRLNPVPPDGYGDQWRFGKLMTNTTWETGDGPNCLVYPQWLVPMESSRWAPLQGEFYNQRGGPNERKQLDVDPYKRTPPRMDAEPGGPVARLWKIYDQTKIEPDELKRHQLVWEMVKIHITDGPYLLGVVANTPYILLVHADMKNVPARNELAMGGFAAPWIHPTPAVYDPETWFWTNPDQHTI